MRGRTVAAAAEAVRGSSRSGGHPDGHVVRRAFVIVPHDLGSLCAGTVKFAGAPSRSLLRRLLKVGWIAADYGSRTGSGWHDPHHVLQADAASRHGHRGWQRRVHDEIGVRPVSDLGL